MGKRTRIGKCHICGNVGELSFEHVPPEKAFNNKPIKMGRFNDRKLKIQQRGMGAYTLCIPCNSNTGSWYGTDFANFCYRGMDILKLSAGNPTLFYFYHSYPLRIIKQIITMMFSVNSPPFADKHSELVKFILDKKRKGLDSNYRFWIYYNLKGIPRMSGTTAMMKISTQSIYFFSEITFPPFGYVMTLPNLDGENHPPDNRLIEITDFVNYDYYEFDYREIKASHLPTYSQYPADYRSSDEIWNKFIKNRTKEI